MECIEALYGDAEFAACLVFRPERHYKDKEKKQRVYHELHTGDWWWEVQVSILYAVLVSPAYICYRQYLNNGDPVLLSSPSS
jgi:hypothetical protein